MAFIQQQRRPVQRQQRSYTEQVVLPVSSDSDNDWHVISSALPSTSTSSVQSISETDSYKQYSDTDDSFSDIDHLLEVNIGTLPSHDGTGTFTHQDNQSSNSISSIQSQTMPDYVPTVAKIDPQELLERGSNNNSITREPQDLDSIPIHHPAGTSAILSIVWNSLSRLKDHLIENEANTLDRLSTIMSEAVLEGCMPFGSHLHMDKSLLEVE